MSIISDLTQIELHFSFGDFTLILANVDIFRFCEMTFIVDTTTNWDVLTSTIGQHDQL